MKAFTIFGGFWGHNQFFLQISRPLLPNFFVCFLFYTLNGLETCVNCVTKCVLTKIYLRKVQILENIFFLRNNLVHFSTIMRPYYQNGFFLIIFFLFFTLNFRMSRKMCILGHKLGNAKTSISQYHFVKIFIIIFCLAV